MAVEVLRIFAIVGVLIAPFAAVSVLLARAETGAWPLYRAWLPALIVPVAVLYGDWAERHGDTARQLDSGTVFLLLLLLVTLLVVRRPHRLAQLSAYAGLAASGFTAAFALTGIFGDYGETYTDQATVAVLVVAAALLTAALLVARSLPIGWRLTSVGLIASTAVVMLFVGEDAVRLATVLLFNLGLVVLAVRLYGAQS
jgi:hypothetical protein